MEIIKDHTKREGYLKKTFFLFLLIPFVLVLSTVFIIDKDLANGVVTGKYFWFYGSMGLASISILFLSCFYPVKFRFTFLDGLVLLYGIVSFSLSYFYHQSEAVTKHILFILLILLYFYFRIVLSINKISRYWLVVFLIVTALLEAVWGLRQLYGFESSQHHLFKMTGSFFNPGPYSGYLAVITPLAFYYVLKDYKVFRNRFSLRFIRFYLRCSISITTVVAVFLVLPAAMSRSSWLAVLGGCGIVAFIFFSKKYRFQTYIRDNIKKFIIVIVILFICLISGLSGMYYLKKDSADGRGLMWKISLRTMLHHPLGVGIGQFAGAYGDEQAAYFESEKGNETEEYVAGGPEYAFNEYLQVGIEQGFLSLFLFLSIIIYALIRGFKYRNTGIVASLVALLIFAFASYPFSVLPYLIVFVFLLSMLTKKEYIKGNNHSVSGKDIGIRRKVPCILIGVLGSGITVLCIYNRYPVYKIYQEWNYSRMLYQTGLYQNASEEYKKNYPFLSDQIQFLFEYGQSLSRSEQYRMSNNVFDKAIKISCDPMLYNIMGKNYLALKEYEQAEGCFRKASFIVPSRIYPYYLLAKLYMETGDEEKAKEMAGIVLTKEPKVMSTAVEEMREEMSKYLIADRVDQ